MIRAKVVMDEKIPYLRDALSQMGFDVVAMPGVDIDRVALDGAVALFVRTRTRCEESLLNGTTVKFIGTATIGYDHIDAAYCAANDIVWTNAAGCNAGAVLQYVQSVLYSWARDKGCDLCGLSLGVVGVGEIGSRVAVWAESVGMTVLRNDPPLETAGVKGLVSLSDIAAKCDVVTFHPTLQRGGEYPSYHLASEAFFDSLQRCRLLINASRGPVVDNVALLNALESGKLPCAVLDVWENEPQVDLRLLNKVYIATPHIAGYSAEGKLNATRIVLDAFARFVDYKGTVPALSLPAPADPVVASSLPDALLGIYSPLADSARLKAAPSMFEELRNSYTLRREPSSYQLVINDK